MKHIIYIILTILYFSYSECFTTELDIPETATIILYLPEDKDKYNLLMDFINTNGIVIVKPEEKLEKEITDINKYLTELAKTAGHTAVFSAGVVFTFFVCAFCNEYPWYFQRLYNSELSRTTSLTSDVSENIKDY